MNHKNQIVFYMINFKNEQIPPDDLLERDLRLPRKSVGSNKTNQIITEMELCKSNFHCCNRDLYFFKYNLITVQL